MTTAIVWSNPSRVDRHRAGRFVLVEANEAGEVRVNGRRDDMAVQIRGLSRVVDDRSASQGGPRSNGRFFEGPLLRLEPTSTKSLEISA